MTWEAISAIATAITALIAVLAYVENKKTLPRIITSIISGAFAGLVGGAGAGWIFTWTTYTVYGIQNKDISQFDVFSLAMSEAQLWAISWSGVGAGICLIAGLAVAGSVYPKTFREAFGGAFFGFLLGIPVGILGISLRKFSSEGWLIYEIVISDIFGGAAGGAVGGAIVGTLLGGLVKTINRIIIGPNYE